jgi:hypothetical protein
VFFAYDANSSLEARNHELLGRCFASICIFPDVSTVIGIGVNVPGASPRDAYSSELVMLHAADGAWPEDYLEKARYCRDKLGYFKAPISTRLQDDEYPVIDQATDTQTD